jgi:hypothetical protein
MTLNDLIRKANAMAMQLSSGDVPICHNGYEVDIDLEFHYPNNEKPIIEINLK